MQERDGLRSRAGGLSQLVLVRSERRVDRQRPDARIAGELVAPLWLLLDAGERKSHAVRLEPTRLRSLGEIGYRAPALLPGDANALRRLPELADAGGPAVGAELPAGLRRVQVNSGASSACTSFSTSSRKLRSEPIPEGG